MSGPGYEDGVARTFYASDPEAIHPRELGWKAWQAICVESRGTRDDRRTSIELRARRARWPETPAPPEQLGMFG